MKRYNHANFKMLSDTKFWKLKICKNVTNVTKKAVYINSDIVDTARKYNIKVSSFKDSEGLDKTVFKVAEKGKLFASKIKGNIEIYAAYVKDLVVSDFSDAISKAKSQKIKDIMLAKEVKELEKAFKKSL